MKRMRSSTGLAAVAVAATVGLAPVARADVTRTEVLDRAKAYTFYPWRATAANETASCAGSDYDSAFTPGDYVGVAYDWGGFASLLEFDQKILAGYGAGSPAGGDVYSCTTGVDCSGFISQSWHTADKYGTSTLPDISSSIDSGDMLLGDVFNKAGYHVAMFVSLLDGGEPFMYEAAGYNTHINGYGGWSYVDGYTPRRYDSITGTTPENPEGTLNNPVAVTGFPYTDSRTTADAPSDLLDGCGASPTTNETGREVVYEVTVTQPGQLTVAVSDDADSDIDVHLFENWNTSSCVARHDSSFTQEVDCGTYLVVADTYGGQANAGWYDLTIDFTPGSSSTCGSGPAGYDPAGAPGDACGYPGNPELPFCNPTLGGDVCLYTSGSSATSFCTAPCATDADCDVLPGGGCCSDIGDGELYCVVSSLCEGGDDTGDDGSSGGDDGSDPGGDSSGSDGSTPAPGPDTMGSSTGGGCHAAGGPLGLWWGAALLLAMAGLRRRRA